MVCSVVIFVWEVDFLSETHTLLSALRLAFQGTRIVHVRDVSTSVGADRIRKLESVFLRVELERNVESITINWNQSSFRCLTTTSILEAEIGVGLSLSYIGHISYEPNPLTSAWGHTLVNLLLEVSSGDNRLIFGRVDTLAALEHALILTTEVHHEPGVVVRILGATVGAVLARKAVAHDELVIFALLSAHSGLIPWCWRRRPSFRWWLVRLVRKVGPVHRNLAFGNAMWLPQIVINS